MSGNESQTLTSVLAKEANLGNDKPEWNDKQTTAHVLGKETNLGNEEERVCILDVFRHVERVDDVPEG